MAIRNIQELSRYIQRTKSQIVRGHAEALLRVTQQAESFAKRNATRQFTGRNGRRLSGRLLNSIFSGVTPFNPGQSLPRGFVGTRGIPYGRIHEFGGTIEPKQAKWLWIKQWGGAADRFRRMTPREFVEKMKSKDRRFKILGSGTRGRIAVFQNLKSTSDPVKLFALSKRAVIPARPYLTPAADSAVEMYGTIARKVLSNKLRKVR